MTKRQHDKLAMYRTVEKVMDDNPSAWNSLPGWLSIKNSFSALIQQLLTTIGEQQTITTGIATDKRSAKKNLVNTAHVMASQLQALAFHTNNNELADAVRFSCTTLFRMRQNTLLILCRNISLLASTHLPALAVYNITNTHLQQLQLAIDNYNSKLPAVGLALAGKRALGKKLKQLFTQTDNHLRFQLDTILLIIKVTHPGFYTSYKAARQINHLGVRHTSFRLILKNIWGNLQAGALVSLLADNKVAYSKPTDINGIVNLSRIALATYSLKIEKEGFTTYHEEYLEFTPGKRTVRKITLK